MGEFRVTDLMKSRSKKTPASVSGSSSSDSPRKTRSVRTNLAHRPASLHNSNPGTTEMGMRDYADLILRYRYMIILSLILGSCIGLYKNLSQKQSYVASAKVIFHNPVDDSSNMDFRPFVIYADTVERLSLNDEILAGAYQKTLDDLMNTGEQIFPQVQLREEALAWWKSLDIVDVGSTISVVPEGEEKDLLLLNCRLYQYQALSPNIANNYCSSLLDYLRKFTIVEYERQLAELSLRIKKNSDEIKSIHSELKLLLDFEDGLTLNNSNLELSDKIVALKNQQNTFSSTLAEKKAQIKSLSQMLKLDLDMQHIEDFVWINEKDPNYLKLQNLDAKINELKTIYPETHPTLKQVILEKEIQTNFLFPNKHLGVYYVVTNQTNNSLVLELRELIYQRKNCENNISQLESNILKLVSQLLRTSEEQSDINKLNSRLEFLEQYRQKLHETQRKLIILKTATVTGYTVLEPAQDVKPSKLTHWAVTTLLGLLAGGALGALVSLLIYSFENTPKYSVDLRRKYNIPVLGVLPQWKDSIYLDPQHPSSTQSELYSILRNNVRFCAPNEPEKAIFIYSPAQNDGKSLTAINLAVCFSLENEKVLLISADLRVPNSLTELLPDPAVSIGICEILGDETLPFESAVHPSKVERLDVIPTLGKVNNPTKLLSGDRFPLLIEHMKRTYDVIIVDTPAILPVVDTASCIQLAQAVVMVVNAGKTTYTEITEALKRCAHVNATTHGFVLNGIRELGLEKFYGTPYKNHHYDDKPSET
jgi:capsular exopolysaccharide synthesis family protein